MATSLLQLHCYAGKFTTIIADDLVFVGQDGVVDQLAAEK